MQVTVNQTVSYQVAKVDVQSVRIVRNSDESLVLLSSFNWIDNKGKIVRVGNGRYSQAELLSSLSGNPQAAGLISAISAIMPASADSPVLSINVAGDTPKVVLMSRPLVDGVRTASMKRMTDADLTAAGLSLAAIAGGIGLAAQALTA